MKFSKSEQELLQELCLCIQKERKERKVSAQALAESIQVSRLTVHRLEQGKPSVSVGVFIKALSALDLTCRVQDKKEGFESPSQSDALVIPAQIPLKDYPELRTLAWHVQGSQFLKPMQAFQIYDRNQRHLDKVNLEEKESRLIEALYLAFEGEEIHV
ncbi:MAG: helix-turn-helix domain-containing protein [Deltaproteobacteria bacterium]|nr:helix-turn-helix domain-containing protein [Deltaproteobacteria bacterium]